MTNHTPPRRPRVLHMAYACAPGYGSELGIGWNRAVQIAKHCDTWVICEEGESAPPVRRYLATNGLVRGLTFAFLPLSRLQKFLMSLPGMYWVAYNLWHRRAFRLATRLHEEIRFDLVHQANLVSYREPGYLWKLDVPFVWGPFGGTQNYPWRFLYHTHLNGAIYEALRSIANNLQLRFSWRVRRAARRAAALLTANLETQRDFTRVHRVESMLMCDTGITRAVPKTRGPAILGQPLHILWSGEFATRKALQLLFAALALLPNDIPFELRIVGDGPLKHRWMRMAQMTGVGARATWLGWISHSEALKQFSWADVLVFTSLRDTTGTVVIEALGTGTPVICLDHQGAGAVVTDACGVKIPVTNPREVISRVTQAISLLALNPAKREQLSRAAVARARDYLWSTDGERLLAVYKRVLRGKVIWPEEVSTCN